MWTQALGGKMYASPGCVNSEFTATSKTPFRPDAVGLEPCPNTYGTEEKRVPSHFQNFCIDLVEKYSYQVSGEIQSPL